MRMWNRLNPSDQAVLEVSMEFFDVVDLYGNPTGETVERTYAHTHAIRHRTAHIWIVRRAFGGVQILLQKRSADKDSFPGKYDTSSAGHIAAGHEPLESAIRELSEELGIEARED
jgi:isopentenyldiphosphate isomerase